MLVMSIGPNVLTTLLKQAGALRGTERIIDFQVVTLGSTRLLELELEGTEEELEDLEG